MTRDPTADPVPAPDAMDLAVRLPVLAKRAREIGELIILASIYREDGAPHTAHGRLQGAHEATEELVRCLAEAEVALRIELIASQEPRS